jgi:hypothetical protein
MKHTFSFRFCGDNQWTIGAGHVKFVMETDHIHTRNFYMKYYLKVSSYKHGDGAELLSLSDKFNLESVFRLCKFFSKTKYSNYLQLQALKL